MSLLESVDTQAREDIEKLRQEQYTQSALIEENKNCCAKRLEQITALETTFGRRVGDLELRFTGCDDKHEAANQHRRKSDHEMSIISATLQESLTVTKQMQATMTQLLTTVEKHAPTVERSNKTHTTLDGLKSFMIYAACIAAFLMGLQQAIELFVR